MKLSTFRLLIILAILAILATSTTFMTAFYSPSAFAQFDEEGEGDSDSEDDSFSEMDEEETSEKKETKEAKSESTDVFGSVEDVNNDDLEKLSKARQTKNEKVVVQAAAAILGKDPNNLDALNVLGVHYFEAKKYGLAKIIFNRALKKHADEPALFNNLGVVYLSEGDMRSALEYFGKSLKDSTNYKIGGANLSSIYLEYKDYSRAIEPLESAYSKYKSDLSRGDAIAVELANNYAIALAGMGEKGKAEDIFEDIKDSGTRNPIPYLNYTILLVEVLKKKNDALRMISKLKFMTEDRAVLRRVEELEVKLNGIK